MTYPKAMTGFFALLTACAIPVTHAVASEMLPDPAFAQTDLAGEWWATSNIELQYQAGALCGLVDGGTAQPWDAIVGINGLTLTADESYRLSITVSGDPGGPMRALAQKASEPWTAEAEIARRVSGTTQTMSEDFTAAETHAQAQLIFQLGGADEAWRFCLHSASLLSGQAPAAETASEAVPAIRVNQLAYFPDGPKHATLVRENPTRIKWELLSSSGETLASGRTKPQGYDSSSGLDVHIIDFAGFRKIGDGYRLVAGDDTSGRWLWPSGRASGQGAQ